MYEGAGHAFACDARRRLYAEESTRTAWQHTLAFLDKHLPQASCPPPPGPSLLDAWAYNPAGQYTWPSRA